jgi:hypothetical protein
MRKSTLLVVLVACFPTTFFGLCDGSELRLELPQGAPITLSQLTFSSDPWGSVGHLTLRNSDPRPLTRIAMAVEMLSPAGSHLVTVPFSAGIRDLEETSLRTGSPIFDGWMIRLWSDAIQSSREASLPGGTPFALAMCPAVARIAALKLIFADGDKYEYGFRELRSEPTLLDAQISLEHCPRQVPFELDALLRVGEDGRAVATFEDSAEGGLEEWLNREIKNWRFEPARIGEQRIAWSFPTKFRFLGKETKQESIFTSSGTAPGHITAVVTVYPDPAKPQTNLSSLVQLPINETGRTVPLDESEGVVKRQITGAVRQHRGDRQKVED